MNITSVVIGILLSALTLAIGVSFWGSVFGSSSSSATAATLINQSKEIVDSLRLYRAKNRGEVPIVTVGEGSAIDLQALVDGGYLKEIPGPWKELGYLSGSPTAIPEVGERSCLMINESVNYVSDDVPSCGSIPAALQNAPYYCCAE